MTEDEAPRRVKVGERVKCGKYIGTVLWRGSVKTAHYKLAKRPLPYGRRRVSEGVDESSDKDPEFMDVLGVEWDSWTRGSHNGTVEGVRYFGPHRSVTFSRAMQSIRGNCDIIEDPYIREHIIHDQKYALMDNYGDTTCSFVREVDLEQPVTVANAIMEKYLMDVTSENAERDPHYVEKGKVHIGHEFVGRSKAVDFFSKTENLLLLVLHSCNINRVGDLSPYCFPKVKELYITNNLISEWSVISGVIAHFPILETLDVSGNMFTSEGDSPLQSPTLKTVSINHSLLNFNRAISILNELPRLTSLSLCNNAYAELGSASELRSLKTLDLSDNLLWNWYTVLRCLKSAPTLKKVVISHNRLSSFVVDPKSGKNLTLFRCASILSQKEPDPMIKFANVEELYLDGNYIYDWTIVGGLSSIFPSLKVLVFKLFTLNKPPSDAVINLHRQVLIAIFPQLKVLNGTEVSIHERVNAERYYIRLASSDHNISTSVDHPEGIDISHSERLELIHGTRDITCGDNPNDSMGSRMVRVILVPDADSDTCAREPVSRKLPLTTSVRDLKCLCSKLFDLDLSQILLVYNDGKMPLCETMADDDVEIQNYGIADGYHIRVQSI